MSHHWGHPHTSASPVCILGPGWLLAGTTSSFGVRFGWGGDSLSPNKSTRQINPFPRLQHEKLLPVFPGLFPVQRWGGPSVWPAGRGAGKRLRQRLSPPRLRGRQLAGSRSARHRRWPVTGVRAPQGAAGPATGGSPWGDTAARSEAEGRPRDGSAAGEAQDQQPSPRAWAQARERYSAFLAPPKASRDTSCPLQERWAPPSPPSAGETGGCGREPPPPPAPGSSPNPAPNALIPAPAAPNPIPCALTCSGRGRQPVPTQRPASVSPHCCSASPPPRQKKRTPGVSRGGSGCWSPAVPTPPRVHSLSSSAHAGAARALIPPLGALGHWVWRQS